MARLPVKPWTSQLSACAGQREVRDARTTAYYCPIRDRSVCKTCDNSQRGQHKPLQTMWLWKNGSSCSALERAPKPGKPIAIYFSTKTTKKDSYGPKTQTTQLPPGARTRHDLRSDAAPGGAHGAEPSDAALALRARSSGAARGIWVGPKLGKPAKLGWLPFGLP